MTAPGDLYERESNVGSTGRLSLRTRYALGRRQGFSLLEILVSMVLACLGVFCFAGLLKVIGNVEAEDTWETKALFCAQERIEELKFDAVTGNVSTTEGKEVLATGSYQGMRREWIVGASSVFDGLLEMRVECSYPWKGAWKAVELSTLVFPEG
jgi:prepilin-type N-terminal cleavage/methylation domain-containing protein